MLHNIVYTVIIVSYLVTTTYLIALVIKRWNSKSNNKLKLVKGDIDE